MGCSFGKHRFNPDNSKPGQGAIALELFSDLHLTRPEIDKFYNAYCEIDQDESGCILIDEFFSYFRLEKTEFNVELFRIFDSDGNGNLTLLEFICVLFNFLSLASSDLGLFMVHIFCGDAERKDKILNHEIENLIKMVHGVNGYERNESLKRVVKDLEKTGTGKSVQSLISWIHDHPLVTNPLFMVYCNMRQSIVGMGFWKRLEKRRYANKQLAQIGYVLKLAQKAELDELNLMLGQNEQQIEDDKRADDTHLRNNRPRRGSILDRNRGCVKSGAAAAGNPLDELDTRAEVYLYQGNSPQKATLHSPTKIRKAAGRRRSSVSKAMDFLRSLGSGKHQQQQQGAAVSKGAPVVDVNKLAMDNDAMFNVSGANKKGKHRKSSIVMAIDAVKSAVTAPRRTKGRKIKVGKTVEVVSTPVASETSAPRGEKVSIVEPFSPRAYTEEVPEWKNASKY